MAPPSATDTPASIPSHSNNGHEEAGIGTHEPGLTEKQAAAAENLFPKAPTFDDKYKEREYQKGRLALAFRIFAKLGYDEGVAGHITLRVCLLSFFTISPLLFYLPNTGYLGGRVGLATWPTELPLFRSSSC
jgi:hypothetical protein